MTVYELLAKLTLDTSEYEEGLSGAQEKAGSFGGKIGQVLGTAGKVGSAAVTAVTNATKAMGTAVVKSAGETAAYGDSIDKMSQKMGMSAEAYQEWDAVLQHSGTSIESMQASMKTLATAAETGNAAFEKLGMTQEEIANMSQQELFEATITALQNVSSETERTYLAGQLLGRGATELGPLLNTSAEETQKMRDRVHELGGVMSDEAVKAAAAYQDSLQDMQTAFSGLQRSLTAEFLPGIKGVMDGLSEVFTGNDEQGLGMISVGIDKLIDNLTNQLPRFMDIGLGIVDALAEAVLQNIPKLAESAVHIITGLTTNIVNKLPDIMSAGIEILFALIDGITESLPELIPAVVEVIVTIVEKLTEPDTLMKLIDAAFRIIGALAIGLINAVPTLIESVPQIIKNLVDRFVSYGPSLIEGGKKLMESLGKGFTDKFEEIKASLHGIVEKIKGIFNFSWEFPKPKLPHFSVNWRDLGIISIPDVSIEWYKKAYDTPYMFNKPTVMGFGDGNGGEMVYGHQNLLNDIKTAIRDTMGSEQPITIIVQSVLDGKVIGETVTKWQRKQARATG